MVRTTQKRQSKPKAKVSTPGLPPLPKATMRRAVLNIPEMMARIQAFNADQDVHNFASTCKTVRKFMKRDETLRWKQVMSQRPERQANDLAVVDYRNGLILEEQPEIKVGQVVEWYCQNNVKSSCAYIVQKIEKGTTKFKVHLRLLCLEATVWTVTSKPRSWVRVLTGGQLNKVRRTPFPQFENVMDMGPWTYLHIIESFEDYVPTWKKFYKNVCCSRKWNNYKKGPNLPKWMINLAGKNKHLIPNA